MDGLFFAFANSIASLVVCMAVGFFCSRRGVIGDGHVSGFTELLVRVAMPATVFMSLMRPFSAELLAESLAALFSFSLLVVLGGFAGGALARLIGATEAEREVWQFGSAFGNFSFMGIPVVLAVFGQEGLIFVSMAMVGTNILSFTYGISIFRARPARAGLAAFLAQNPVIPAAALGFVFFVTELRLPKLLESGAGLLDGLTAPLSMLVIGAVLSRGKLSDAFTDFRALPHVALRLAALPVASLLLLGAAFGDGLMVRVLACLMAMPVGAITVLLAEKYAEDPAIAARFVVATTLLSVITVPLFSLLL